jgi:hypothetical protein
LLSNGPVRMRCCAPGPRPGSAALLGAWQQPGLMARTGTPRTGTPRTETRGAESDAPVAGAVALLADASLIPQWAPAFADEVRGDARAGWQVTKDGRVFTLKVAVDAGAGTVDYLREVAPGHEGGAYIRAVPRPGGGSVIVIKNRPRNPWLQPWGGKGDAG